MMINPHIHVIIRILTHLNLPRALLSVIRNNWSFKLNWKMLT